MPGPKPRGLFKARIERIFQSLVFAARNEVAQRRLPRKVFDEATVLHRSVAMQLVEKTAQGILAVIDLEQGIHRRHDARLATGLAAKGLRLAVKRVDPFIDQPAAFKRRIVGPTMNIRAHTVEIDVGIAPLGHSREMPVNAFPRLVHFDQQACGFAFIA